MAASEHQQQVEFWSNKVRYHRAMAIACAGDEARCDEHAAKMHEALERLRKLALDNLAEANP